LTTQYQYDGAGRFMTKKINPLSQATDYVYATATATLTSEKDFKNNTTSYEYDGWQRLKKITNPDGTVKNTTSEWHAAGNERLYTLVETFTGNPTTREHFDGLNRKVSGSVVGFDGAQIFTDYAYDTHGRLQKTSLPYKTGSPQWEIREYDLHDRLTKITAAAGAISTFVYSNSSVTETINGVATTKTADATGLPTSVSNPAGTISYVYRPDGQVSSITAPSAGATTFTYDALGRQTQIADRSAGTVEYTYDAAGNLNKVTDANNKSVASTFDGYNRIIAKTSPEFNTTYTYNTDGWLTSISNTNGTSKAFIYDNLGRVTQTTETTGTENYQVNYTFANGKLTKTVHAAASYTVNYLYNSYGYLYKLTNASGTALKTINKITNFGQVEETLLGNGLVQTHTFNSFGVLTGIKTMNGGTTVQNMTYTVDNQKGNMTSRMDATRNLTENFTYDNLDRLLTYGLPAANRTIAYNNATGNITAKSDVGTYKYNTSGKPYAMSSITVTSGNTIPTQLQEVTYTSFARPKQLKEGTYTADFTYNEDYDRVKQEFKTSGNLTWTRYYFNGGQYEKTIQGGNTKTIFYVDGSPYTATVALENNNGTTRLLYISRDHLSSITHITNASKVLQAEYSYDAWGRMRNPANLAVYALGADPVLLLNRGYTGHEHAKEFGLINMNARLYDPLVGRMISPDNFVEDPLYSDRFNRFAYANNNPLIYSDPDGNHPVIVGLIIGAIIGAYTGGVIANSGEYNLFKWDYRSGQTWGYMLGGAIVGGISGAWGASIAVSGMPFANTFGIMTGSFVSSVGMSMITDGQTNVSMSFGFASYNFDTGTFGFLGKKGNSAIKNIGYGLGALANMQDVFAGINGGGVDVKARKDIAGHSWIEGDGINISVGPGVDNKPNLDGIKWESQYLFNTVKGRNFITSYDPKETFSTTLNNVNASKLQRMTNFLNRGLSLSGKHSLNYGVWNGCVNQTSRALFMSGVFNVNAFLPITSPVLLNAELALRNYGMMFSYYMATYK
ncbi:MAG TPA: RHS repeat-associated core domain-containing protein, partial [Agriterribacter sp.]|nr:RHS repeat-associated core domain-containing protein [Agriterribacter sp.]